MNLRDLIWPVLEPLSDVAAAQDAARYAQDLETIRAATPSEDLDTLVEEARRLADAETDRWKTAEARAKTYLTVAGVLVPILAGIAPTVFAANDGLPRPLISLLIFMFAGAYLLRGGLWALRTIRVEAWAQLDAVEVIEIWGKAGSKAELAKALLDRVRRNRGAVNAKVSCIKMAHEFWVRALCVFVVALIVRAVWDPAAALLKLLC